MCSGVEGGGGGRGRLEPEGLARRRVFLPAMPVSAPALPTNPMFREDDSDRLLSRSQRRE